MNRRIPIAEPDLTGKEKTYLLDALLKEKRISSGGKYIDKFEALGAKYFQRKFASSCSNGTVALHLALLALGIRPGNEVILPTMTFAACAAAVVYCGATPVFIDSNLDDWTLDIKQLDSKLTSKTKAVMAVDLYGLPANYDYLQKWCQKNKLFLIEDAAEAHGAEYKGKPAGSFGHASCFSFYGNKVLTTGEGGLCLTNDKKIHERIKIFKNHGMKRKGVYEHELIGYNYRLTNIQAAIGCAQFDRFKEFLEKRRRINLWYQNFLKDSPAIRWQKFNQREIRPVCWLCSCLVKSDIGKVQRFLANKGIETRPFFKPLHRQTAYKKFAGGQKFPNAEYLFKYGLSLPTSVKLTEKDVKFICDNLKTALQ